MIGRRATLVGGGAALLAGRSPRSQPAPTLPRIAVVEQGGPVEDIAVGQHPYWDAFLRSLSELGHIEGETIAIERWTAGGQDDQGFARLARMVVETQPDVIVSRGSRAVAALGSATATIPIVATAGMEPFVASLARPGGNITGINGPAGAEITVKRLQLLHDAVPTAARIAWLGPADFWAGRQGERMAIGAEQLGLTLVPVFIQAPTGQGTVRSAFSSMAGEEFDALYISASPDMMPYRPLVAELALAAGLPSVGYQRGWADAGAMMAYGPDTVETFRRLADYVDQILNGGNPAEMPIEQPTEFEFVVNLRTAAALGLTLPTSILTFATEVIE